MYNNVILTNDITSIWTRRT